MYKVTMYFDGNKNFSGVSCSYRLTCGDKFKEETIPLSDSTTVPQAEYSGLLMGLKAIKNLAETDIEIFGDSQLIVNQVNNVYETKNSILRVLRSDVRNLLAKFKSYKLEWKPRKENKVG